MKHNILGEFDLFLVEIVKTDVFNQVLGFNLGWVSRKCEPVWRKWCEYMRKYLTNSCFCYQVSFWRLREGIPTNSWTRSSTQRRFTSSMKTWWETVSSTWQSFLSVIVWYFKISWILQGIRVVTSVTFCLLLDAMCPVLHLEGLRTLPGICVVGHQHAGSSLCVHSGTHMLRIWDVYPGSWFLPFPDPGSRIPEPKTATKDRSEKKFLVIPFYVATNFTKMKIILVLKCWRKNLSQFKRIIEHFTQKIVTKLSKIWFWDPRSGIQKKHIQDPWSRGQKGTESRIRIRNTDGNVPTR